MKDLTLILATSCRFIFCSALSLSVLPAWAGVEGVTDSGRLIIKRDQPTMSGYWLLDLNNVNSAISLDAPVAGYPKLLRLKDLTVSRDEKTVTALSEHSNDNDVAWRVYQKDLSSSLTPFMSKMTSYNYHTNATATRLLFESEHDLLGDYPAWALPDRPRPEGCVYSNSRFNGYCLYNTSSTNQWKVTRVEKNPELKNIINSEMYTGTLEISDSGKYAFTHANNSKQYYLVDLETMAAKQVLDNGLQDTHLNEPGYDVYDAKNFFIVKEGKELLAVRVNAQLQEKKAGFLLYDPETGNQIPFDETFPQVAKWNRSISKATDGFPMFTSLNNVFLDEKGHPRSRISPVGWAMSDTRFQTIDWITGEIRSDFDYKFDSRIPANEYATVMARSPGGRYTILVPSLTEPNRRYFLKDSESDEYIQIPADIAAGR